MFKEIFYCFLLVFVPLILPAQKTVLRGFIYDELNVPLVGVNILNKNTNNSTQTNSEGIFSISVSFKDSILISYIGYQSILLIADSINKSAIKFNLQKSTNTMDEVVVVGYGTQKRQSMVSAITTVDIEKIRQPSSNLTTMFAGQIPGMIAYQRTGEPGRDNASFFIRGLSAFGSGKQDPLILIDNIESTTNDLARLQPDDISKFSVLKDATAVAVYGARGANGVLLITTKSGKIGKSLFFFRSENSINSNTQHVDFANNITYMQLANEAALTRDPLAATPYSQNKID